MARAWMKGFFAITAMTAALAVQPVSAMAVPSTSGSGRSGDSAPASKADILRDRLGYLSRYFHFDALNPDVKDAVIRANLPPVSFNQMVLHTRDTVITTGQQRPATYSSSVTLQNAGHGLIRGMEAVQDRGTDIALRFELTYRGYFSFLVQGVSLDGNNVPPIQSARKIIRFDTGTHGHLAFIYLYGKAGEIQFRDPGQFICDSGKTYPAAQINPSMAGQASELHCTAIDSNGIVTDKVTMAYLEHYGVAVTLRTSNDQRTVDSAVVDFSVR